MEHPRSFLRRYQVLCLLGEGGTSRVYLAQPVGGGNEVVVKVMHQRVAFNPRFNDCFQREIMLLTRFRHPNAVALLEAATDETYGPCLVMEYIRGVELAALLERCGSLSLLRTGRMLVQMCRVLQAAHNQGIVHRDLKPGNLMVVHPDTPSENIKVMDFGLGQLATPCYIPLEKLTRSGEDYASGTPEYMSPEELRHDPVDGRCDLYSLGVILYQLLTGRLPFAGNLNELFQAHLEKKPPSLAAAGITAPPGIEALIQSCLAKYPIERPGSARALAELYEQALGQRLIAEPFDDNAPAPQPGQVPPQARASLTADEDTIVHELEAFLPEQIAVMKLRGFVDDLGGEAIESVPGRIRVRLGESREPVAAGGPGLRQGSGSAQRAPVPAPPTTLMELHMQKKANGPQNVLRLTILLRPEGGRPQATDPEWHSYCDRIYSDLRAYLMGRG